MGTSSRDLQSKIAGSRYFAALGELTACLKELCQPGDLVLTVGAGDIYLVGEALAEEGDPASL